jgi:hypothetical protein
MVALHSAKLDFNTDTGIKVPDWPGRYSARWADALQEGLELVHAIQTDDAYGIEEYWHKRSAAMNTKGEWFSLTRHDIEAFKKAKIHANRPHVRQLGALRTNLA